VAIYRLLQNAAFDPETIEILAKSYEDTLRCLNLDRADPRTELIAKKIFENAQTGERNADRLRDTTLAQLGIVLPADEAPHLASASEASLGKSQQTVLIVEDDEASAYALSRYFESLGYSAVVASGSMMAFRELDLQQVDVVVTDVRLGRGEPHGVALGRMIRNRDNAIPIFLITAYPDSIEAEKPLPGPFFVKPVDLGELTRAVKASLAR
jgi:CheY-like chemotaxis protein